MKRINFRGIGLQQQLLENFSEVYGNRRSIAQFIRDRHLSIYQANITDIGNNLLGKTSTEYYTICSSLTMKL